MTYGDGCTCGPYMSVIPPGPCPVHTPPTYLPARVSITWPQTSTQTWTWQTAPVTCTGRHCAECA